MIDQFSQAVGILVSGILLVRFLGTAGFGLVTLATVATSLAIIVNTAVLLDPSAQISQSYAGQAPAYARTVLGLAGLLSLPLALLSALMFAVMAPSDYTESFPMLALVAVLAIAQTLYFTIRRLSLATHRGAVAAGLSSIGAVSLICAALSLRWWEMLSVGSWIAVQSAIYAGLAAAGALLTCRGGGSIDTKLVIRAHRRQAQPLLAMNGANFIAVQSPVIILDHYVGAAAVGVFRSLLNLVQPFTLLILSLMNAFVPIAARSREPGIAPDIAGAVCVLVLCTLGSASIALEARLLPLLFGQEFHSPRYALAVLLGGVLFQAIQLGTVIRFRAIGYLRPLAMAQVFAAIAALVTAMLLVAQFGIMGAAVASAAALAASCLYILLIRISVRRCGR